ncbi:DUF2948 family protein [Roseovarius atlanticus]|uniref:DUF2948 family protein n=1 Tax=Roseovarius atlanticus TaxID=1641875 RepID=UPI001C95B388|nr:DUF2948 family protein [Roseovarius atlanticus]MBY5986487.1 DUF2948 family protein [Roseovarius atlanticus]MBY6125127.1 DUF2948 family protein [Roseovarius atlanticus]MBY6150412.1 DUF2948 family protein [Roseovarius atlanticus]
MTEDAKFEDGREAPLNLGAFDAEDLEVLSSLVQDAVFTITDMAWRPQERRLAFLVNRFRWEDEGRQRHGAERVRSVLVIDNVLGVASQGIDRGDTGTILSVLSIGFEPDAADDVSGHITLTLAGDGAVRARIEALEVNLRDVTRPYRAPSGKAPDHGA